MQHLRVANYLPVFVFVMLIFLNFFLLFSIWFFGAVNSSSLEEVKEVQLVRILHMLLGGTEDQCSNSFQCCNSSVFEALFLDLLHLPCNRALLLFKFVTTIVAIFSNLKLLISDSFQCFSMKLDAKCCNQMLYFIGNNYFNE